MIKAIKCNICKLAPGKVFCYAPIGKYCNVNMAQAGAGSIVDFIDGWHTTRVILTRKCLVSVNSAVFTFLLKHIYGNVATWEHIKGEWEALCINEGIGANAFSNDEVMLIEYRPFVEKEYEAEQIAKKKERERIEKANAQARMLEMAQHGIFQHPDIIS